MTLEGATEVVLDKTITLTATVVNAENTAVTWRTSEETVLTVADGVVTAVGLGKATITATSVADTTKSASLEITVIDKYAFRITENNTYKIEAEDLDFSHATLRSDLTDFIESPTGDAAAKTSGGKSIRGVVGPSTLTISFYSGKSSKIHFNGRFANYVAGYTLDDNVKRILDGTTLETTGSVFGGHSSPTDFWPWQDVNMGDMIVPAGEHSFALDVTGSLPNADYLSFVVTDYDATDAIASITDNGTSTFEAENMDLTNLVISPDAGAGRTKESLIENATDASNGKSLCGIGAGTVLTAEFYLGDEAVVTPVARMASYGDTFDVDAKLEFKLDDTVINSNGYKTFGHTDTNPYWNWKNVKLTETVLKRGFHTFTYKAITDSINLDAFLLETTYYGKVNERGLQLNDNGTYVVEAESIKVTAGSYGIENPTGAAAAITSGGQSIGNVAVGTQFEIPFVLGKTSTVDVIAVLAKYEDTYNLDANVTFKIDDVLVTTGFSSFGHTDSNLWWNWKNISLKRGVFAAGRHVLSVVANGLPNADCFKFNVSGYGDDFAANANGTYRVEAETLPYDHLTFDGAGAAGRIEGYGTSSGGLSLGHIDSGYIEIPFYLEDKGSVTTICFLAKYEAMVVGERYKVYMDGVEVTFQDPTQVLGRAEDGSNNFFNWKQVPLTAQALAAGEHIFKFECAKAPVSMDCFDFVVASYGA